MKRAGVLVAVVCMLGAGCAMKAQEAKPAAATGQSEVAFAFERKGLPVSKYRFTVHSDGNAVYEGEEMPPVSPYGPPANPAAIPFRAEVAITPTTAERIFSLERQLGRFNLTCASKAKNIADTGTKTLSYQGSDGSGACTYNYSENKDVQMLTQIFQGMAETMDTGRRLDHLHRFDRLGLDEAIAFLAQEVAAGRALEVGTIASSLRSIAGDTEVMQRVRAKAQSLLAMVPGSGPSM